jgi:hypothetical protein
MTFYLALSDDDHGSIPSYPTYEDAFNSLVAYVRFTMRGDHREEILNELSDTQAVEVYFSDISDDGTWIICENLCVGTPPLWAETEAT